MAGCCWASAAPNQRKMAKRLLDRVRALITSRAPTLRETASEPLLLEFRSDCVARSEFVAVASNTKSSPVKATFCILELARAQPVCEPPFSLRLARGTNATGSAGGLGPPQVRSDEALCLSLAAMACDWAVAVLTIGPIVDLSLFEVVARQWCADGGRTGEDQAVQAALAALQTLGPRREAGIPASVGQAPQRRSRRSQGKAASAQKMAMASAWSSEESEASELASGGPSASEPETEDGGADRGAADAFDAERSANSEAAVPAPPQGSSAWRRQRAAGASAGPRPTRSAAWGPFTIAPVVAQGGRQIGWGAVCGLHTDPEGSGALPCKRGPRSAALLAECRRRLRSSDGNTRSARHEGQAARRLPPRKQVTALGSDPEGRVRLKRWLLAGLEDEDWPENKRSYHIALGGQGLASFATGLSETELDQQLLHHDAP